MAIYSGGPEFLVNTETLGYQSDPAITSLGLDKFLVTWSDSSGVGGDADGFGAKAQIFDASGAKVGSEFLVNTETLNDQREPVVASLASGGFVVTWVDGSGQGGDASEQGIKAQIFDAAGAKVGLEFLVNTQTLGEQGQLAITALASGGFVVSWADFSGQGGDADGYGIKAQIFDPSGAKVGSEFLVNTETQGPQAWPAITSLPTGGFVVSWDDLSGRGDDPDFGVRAQIFDAYGARLGSEFLVNLNTLDLQVLSASTSLATGAFVVSWTDYSGQGGDPDVSVKARIFSPLDELSKSSGTTGNDDLAGTAGADLISGLAGDDALSGHAGDDLLIGHAGADRLYGGSGDDQFDGGDGNDVVSGSTGNDFAHGGASDDLIAGGEGNDRLLGELGDDRLNGGAGKDVLEGGDGRDTLIGGAGKDTMTGGAGPDQFLFMPGDSRSGGSFRDVITDFTSGEDVLHLRALGITDYAAQVSTQTIGSGIIVHVDIDGDGFDYTDFAVLLGGVDSLPAGDLLL